MEETSPTAISTAWRDIITVLLNFTEQCALQYAELKMTHTFLVRLYLLLIYLALESSG